MSRHLMGVCMLLLLGCQGGADADESAARASQCTRLRDHLVDLRLASAQGLENVEQHRRVLTQAMGTDFVGGCVKTMTDAQATCALAATDQPAVAECMTGSESN